MADFGDPSLFEEFTKERESSDKILLSEKSKQSNKNSTKNPDASENADDSLGNGENETNISQQADDANENESAASACLDSAISIGKPINTKADQNATYSALKEDYERASIQNEHMSRQCRLLDPSRFSSEDEGPLMQILFMNTTVSRKYRAEIEYFIHGLISKERRRRSDPPSKLPNRPNFVQVGQLNPLAGPSERAKFLHTNSIIGSSQMYGDCVVDSIGWPLTDYNIHATEGWEIPRFEQVFRKALPVDPEEEEKEQRLAQHPKSTCFNCGGDHQLMACTEPKNLGRISKARQEFMANSPGNKSQARYIEDDPRFSKFKAGILSDSLRKALGLQAEQLPPYIYRMRTLGYPPGHLEEATKRVSGLTVFDSSGKEVPNSADSDKEDGEVNESKRSNEAQYDIQKIVQYPGFNVDIPKGFIDESSSFRAPKMQHFQMKQYFESQNKKHQRRPLKRKITSEEDTTPSKKSKVTDDMDISIDDTPRSPDLIVTDAWVPDEEAQTPPQAEEEPLTETPSLIATPRSGNSLSMSMGTPLGMDDSTTPKLQLSNSLKGLPSSDQFAEGIQEHLNFENLPDSTGRYRSIQKILDMVKDVRADSANAGKS